VRDIVFLGGFVVMMAWGIRFPHVGVMLWAWTAMIVHNAYTYGFASRIPFNKISAGVTLILLLVSRDRKRMPANITLFLIFMFMVWGIVSTFTTASKADWVSDILERLIKIIVFVFVVVVIVNRKSRIDALLYALYLSLGFHGIVEGAKFLASAGGHHINGPGQSIIADNNHFALAMVGMLPIVFYLYHQATSKMLKICLAASGFLVAVAVMGTFSRGGFVGIAAVGALTFVRSKAKLRFAAIVVPLAVLAIAFAPERWSERMDTIKAADQDNSFMGRVIAWKQSTLIAMKNPVFGGGFHAVQDFTIWTDVSRDFHRLSFVPTEEPDTKVAWAAHSIYFEVLGDLGFGGLAIFLLILATSWRNAAIAMRLARKRDDLKWALDLCLALQYVLVAYVVSGAALSLAYFDFIYIVFGVLVVVRDMVERSVRPPVLSAA